MTRLQVYETGLPPRKRMEGLRNQSSRRFVGVGRREGGTKACHVNAANGYCTHKREAAPHKGDDDIRPRTRRRPREEKGTTVHNTK